MKNILLSIPQYTIGRHVPGPLHSTTFGRMLQYNDMVSHKPRIVVNIVEKKLCPTSLDLVIL